MGGGLPTAWQGQSGAVGEGAWLGLIHKPGREGCAEGEGEGGLQASP
jgi:hypothetical protein